MRDASVPMPGRYSAEIVVMQEMHWSWHDLCSAPADLVEELLTRREYRMKYEDLRKKRDEQRAENDAKAMRVRGRTPARRSTARRRR